MGFKDRVNEFVDSHLYLHKAVKAVNILFHDGGAEFKYKFQQFKKIHAEEKEYERITGHKPVNDSNIKDFERYCPYDSEYQDNVDFSGCETDIKPLAFYLPQYHTFPENDEWWGEGFTEWTNVRKGTPRFEGHYQPRVPHSDMGYYCLEDINVMRKQADLAKQHGIYGFCFYYYWFSGKRLMEKPVDLLLEHKDIDIPFCLCWANENWTRTWDGQNKNVLIGQEYSDHDDEIFMVDMKKYIDDPRYIRISGKPVVVVYNPGQIPNCRKSFSTWRRVAKEIGIGEILIWTCQTSNNSAEKLKITDVIDAEVEFPPNNVWLSSLRVTGDEEAESARLYNYHKMVDFFLQKMEKEKASKIPLHHSLTLAWDNAARRKKECHTLYAFSLRDLYRWTLGVMEKSRETLKEDDRFIFINAWNEWGEGTYLEPDEKYGYANINTVSKALFEKPLLNDLVFVKDDTAEMEPEVFDKAGESRIAVQIHMFYTETLDETIHNLNGIPFKYDCYFSTDTEEKKQYIEQAVSEKCSCEQFKVEVIENRGRDVAPFIVQMAPVIDKYDYLCHIHSKKTLTNSHGNEWREYIFRHLFGRPGYIKKLINLLEADSSIGILMPETYPVLEFQAEWGGNKQGTQALLKRLGIEEPLPDEPTFPVGNMFWARTASIKKMFDGTITQKDFPEEAGQENGTLGHQIERSWVYLAKDAGYSYKKVFNALSDDTLNNKLSRLGIYVHYDKSNTVSDDDLLTIKAASEVMDSIVFVTNSKLDEAEVSKVRPFVTEVMTRENRGLDFGAWKDVLTEKGREFVSGFDQLILFNNSSLAPCFSLVNMFNVMDAKMLDFWGVTLFPETESNYTGEKTIPEHLQSYFVAYNRSVLESDAFWDFWKAIPENDDYISVIRDCETKFTQYLAKAGFSYGAYLEETRYLSLFLKNYSIPYTKPASLLLLGSPLVKKKYKEYAGLGERIRVEALMEALK